jgi:lipopolysaccharide transport system ATP-binding protein
MNIIQIENLWKEYRLGIIDHGTLTHDLQSWWARLRGKDDPNAKIVSKHNSLENQTNADHFWALRDIHLEIKSGEILGIIGKNGAGKSTLLKILSRVTAPTKGIIKIKGRIASLLEVGTGFHPELTGLENIYLNGAILGMSKQETKSRMDEIVEFSGIGAFIETPVKRYSSGMYVRLAFAVAAHLEPEILVIDEVLAVGDAEFQKKCINKIKIVGESGRTVLFVSHNIASVRTLCSRGVIIDKGSIMKCGPVQEIVSQYLSDVSEQFNDLKVRTTREGDGRLRVTAIEFIDEQKNTISSLISGQDIEVRISYDTEGLENGTQIKVGLQVCTVQGIPVFFNHNELSGTILKGYKKNGCICCKIRRLPLVPSEYILNVSIRVLGGELLDKIQSAAKFNVIGSNYYSTGKYPDVKYGVTLIDADWYQD